MIILAADPGTYETGWVTYDTEKHEVYEFGISTNADFKNKSIKVYKNQIGGFTPSIFAYEMIGHYGTGMSVGNSVFETCIWIGRFEEAWGNTDTICRVLNREIRLTLCGSVRAKEKNVHLATKQKFEPTGGGKDPYKGTKAQPGPLYGMKSHIFSALAVALTWKEMYGKENK